MAARLIQTRKISAACALASLISHSIPYLPFVSGVATEHRHLSSFSSLSSSLLLPPFSSSSSSTLPHPTKNKHCYSSSSTSSLARKMSMSTSSSTSRSTLTVAQIPCLDDNYGYLIHDPETGHTAAVDTPDANAYEAELKNRGWKLTHIFNTHHHWDHTGGNLQLKENSDDVKIYGPASENIPGCDVALNGGDEVTSFSNSDTPVQIIDVGGHTSGHIAYFFPKDNLVFCGDALFALGCGKMFEGTPSQFWGSLKRLRALPDDTVVYCAHEYTQSNAKFAMSVEPGNIKLVSRVADITSKRKNGKPTVPSLLSVEKETNPFLRVDVSDEIQKNVGALSSDSDDVVFGKVRKAKDNFRG